MSDILTAAGSSVSEQRKYHILKNILNAEEHHLLFHASSAKQAEFVEQHLAPEEMHLYEKAYLEDKVLFVLGKQLLVKQGAKFLDIYKPVNQKDYNLREIQWFRDCKYFLGEKMRRAPNSVEVIDEFNSKGCPIQFKLWYLYHFPDNMVEA